MLQEAKTDGKSWDISYQIIIIPHHVEPCTLLGNQSTVDACTFWSGKTHRVVVGAKQANHHIVVVTKQASGQWQWCLKAANTSADVAVW